MISSLFHYFKQIDTFLSDQGANTTLNFNILMSSLLLNVHFEVFIIFSQVVFLIETFTINAKLFADLMAALSSVNGQSLNLTLPY